MEFTKLTRRGRERVREVFTGRRVSSLSSDEVQAAHRAGYEPGSNDWLVGRDPRTMSQDELRAMGHQPAPLIAIIRAKCLDCMAGSPDEVRSCLAMTCPNWPVRLSKNVWRAPASDAQREAARRNAIKMRAGLSNPVIFTGDDGEDDG